MIRTPYTKIFELRGGLIPRYARSLKSDTGLASLVLESSA